MRRLLLAAPLAIASVLAAGASCDSNPNTALPTPEFSSVATPTGTPPTTGPTTNPATTTAPPQSDWPSPEDCVSYNPNNVTKNYEAGRVAILDGNKVVMRFSVSGPSDIAGDQGLALAKRWKKHCYIGRNNNREYHNEFVFDYWRDASGSKPSIPDLEEICGDYDRRDLTVEDMGNGDGWRVKYGDNPLQHFDNGNDAKNGKIVLAKYGTICRIGQGGDEDDPEVITFFP